MLDKAWGSSRCTLYTCCSLKRGRKASLWTSTHTFPSQPISLQRSLTASRRPKIGNTTVAHGYSADRCHEQLVCTNPELGPPSILTGHHSRTLEGPYQTTDLHPPWPPILMSSTVSHQESSLPSWADRRAGWSLLEWEQGCEVVAATAPEIS